MKHYGFDQSLEESEQGFIFGAEESEGAEIVRVGRLTEYGPSVDVFMDVSQEKVVAIFGKRGQGKSYTLGAFVEGLVTRELSTSISNTVARRAVLLFDTLDIFQWMGVPLTAEHGAKYPEIQRQSQDMTAWGISPEPLEVEVWRPAGFRRETDQGHLKDLQLCVSDFCIEDWGLLLGLDTVTKIKGQLLADVFMKVTSLGWDRPDGSRADSITEYAIDDLLECLDNDSDFTDGHIYNSETVRAVRQQLQAFSRALGLRKLW